jgi:tetratricopeptide (TPR) repeat protein
MPIEPNIHPFPGLRHFETDEEDLFFGREGQSEEILRRLRQHRFLAVVGASGSGKSSLIRAGLLPYLHGGFLAAAGSHWRVAIFRPGNDPIANLAAALNHPSVLGQPAESADQAARNAMLLEVSLRRSGLGLIEAVRLARLPEREQVVVVVDQFEELFRFANASGKPRQEDDAAAFVKLLLEAKEQSELPVYVVLTMRSDFIGDCARYRDLPEAVTTGLYLIPRMTREQRRAAIVEPVRVGGGSIAPRLVNRLLNDVGDNPDQLPILQHALMRTWDYWRKHHADELPIDLDDYRAIGGMAEALSLHADEAYDGLTDDRYREIARRMFQALTEKGLDNREARRPTTVGTLAQVTGVPAPDIILVVDQFRRPGRSFLMPPAGIPLDDSSVIDISHESLIRGWKRLRKWVDEEADSAKVYRRLAQTAALHAQGTAGLWHDPDLEHALAWRDKEHPNAAWAERYDPGFDEAMAFLEKSRVAREAARLEEELRRDRELRRAHRLVYATLAALVVFVIFGGYSWYLWQQAEFQRQQAERKEIQANVAAAAARLAAEDQRAEVRRSRQQLLDSNETIIDLAETVVDNSSPLAGVNARRQLEVALSKTGDHTGALRRLNEIMTADPDKIGVLSSRGYMHVVMVNPDEAIKDIERYLAEGPRSLAYLNLSVAFGMKQEYDKALAAIAKAIEYHVPFGDPVFDSEVSPDIQAATGHTVIYADSTSFLAAMYYQIAVLHAFKGGGEFENALRVADQHAAGAASGVDTYLLALEWAWLELRAHEYGNDTVPKDYGVFAAYGALWERAAEVNPRFFDWARQYYMRFQSAHESEGRREPRYAALSQWTAERLRRKEIVDAAPAPAPDKTAEELILEGKELETKSSSPLANAEAHGKYTAAIRLLEKNLEGAQAGRQKDLLIDVLLRRGNVRERVGDRRGAAEDARRVIALNPNLSGAYTLLAETTSDNAEKRAHYEKAFAVNPFDTGAMNNLATMVEKDDPKRALELLQRRLRLYTRANSQTYERIARLQLRVGQKEEAAESIRAALTIAPYRTALYVLRQDIDRALGYSESKAALRLAAGYRAAAEGYARVKNDGQAVIQYMRALQTAVEVPADADSRFEVEAAVRGLTDFLIARHSEGYAHAFWKSLASSSVMKDYKVRAEEEVRRLEPRR